MKIKTSALFIALTICLAGCAGQPSENAATGTAQATPPPSASAPVETSEMPATGAAETTAPVPPINPSYTPEQAKMAPKTLPEFTTVDIDGNEFDRSLLQGNKLTMVYYWATYCPYCKDELPYMAKIGNDMPEGSRFISVVMDIYGDEAEENATARQLVEEHGIEFPLLKMDGAGALKDHAFDETRDKPFLKPTTVFYDENGEQVGDIMIGTFSEEQYRQGLAERLESLSGATE